MSFDSCLVVLGDLCPWSIDGLSTPCFPEGFIFSANANGVGTTT